jgi:hypothetical protein
MATSTPAGFRSDVSVRFIPVLPPAIEKRQNRRHDKGLDALPAAGFTRFGAGRAPVSDLQQLPEMAAAPSGRKLAPKYLSRRVRGSRA